MDKNDSDRERTVSRRRVLAATYAGEDALPFTHREFDGEWVPGHHSSE